MFKDRKVFCNNCRYISSNEICTHPDNKIYRLHKANWKLPERVETIGYKSKVSIINKYNDCKMYKRYISCY